MSTVFDLTPIQDWFYAGQRILVKRDDMCEIAGVRGGKVRTCCALATKGLNSGKVGLTTAGSRSSPQVNIVANIAKFLEVPCVAHTPTGELNQELKLAQVAGAKIIQHKAGYNNVIIARSREYAKLYDFVDIPFGMECDEAVKQTGRQVENITYLADPVKRIVVPVGSGMSLCGIIAGLKHFKLEIPVLGVIVGANPYKRMAKYQPGYSQPVNFVEAGVDYHEDIDAKLIRHNENLGHQELLLDPVYEAKCAKFLEPGDLLWNVGIRQSLIHN